MPTMIRVEKKTNYVVMNKEALENINLSWKAKGLLVYLLSLPDNWQIYIDELSSHAKDGIDSTSSAIKELINNGYITRERNRDEKGRLRNYDYTVHEVPKSINSGDNEPKVEKPILEKPRQGKPILEKRQLLNNNKLNNNLNLEEEENQRVEVADEVIKNYKDCISQKITTAELEILSRLQDEMGKDLLIKAIQIALQKNGKNLGYIKTVLTDWKSKSLRTEDEVNLYLAKWITKNQRAKENREKQIEKRADNKNYGKKVNTFNDYPQRDYDYNELERRLLGLDKEGNTGG